MSNADELIAELSKITANHEILIQQNAKRIEQNEKANADRHEALMYWIQRMARPWWKKLLAID